ncbi:MAG: hypothetical protein IH621_09115 [Krumholzibacteria bacterium]|nr:hypothetical protein [Candidatus Krumholzibacteria bacterium]
MKRRLVSIGFLLLLMAGAAGVRAADGTAASDPVKLRGWYLGLQGTSGARDRWDVFNNDDLPPAAVQDVGRGFGLQLGHRFGGRFLLGLHFAVQEHDLAGLPQKLHDVELLFAGTVLWNERGTLQPFARGGLGGSAVAVDRAGGHIIAIGTAATAGGGLQVRLGAGFALEAEAALTFANLLEVRDQDSDGATDDDWRVKASQVGWRTGVGVVVWF